MFRKHRLRKFKFLIPFSAMILSFSFPALCNWQGNGLDQDNTLGSGSVRWHTEGYTASKVDVGFEHMNPGWAELFKYILEAQGAGQPLDATKLESLAGACEENDIYQQQDNGGNRYYRHPGQPEKSSFRVNASSDTGASQGPFNMQSQALAKRSDAASKLLNVQTGNSTIDEKLQNIINYKTTQLDQGLNISYTHRSPAEQTFMIALNTPAEDSGAAAVDFTHVDYSKDSDFTENAEYWGSLTDPWAIELNGIMTDVYITGAKWAPAGAYAGDEMYKHVGGMMYGDQLGGTNYGDYGVCNYAFRGQLYTLEDGFISAENDGSARGYMYIGPFVRGQVDPQPKEPSHNVDMLIQKWRKLGGKSENQIRSRYAVMAYYSPFSKTLPPKKEEEPVEDRGYAHWEIGKDQPFYYTWHDGDTVNNTKYSHSKFNLHDGIPAKEYLTNGYIANRWYGKAGGNIVTKTRNYDVKFHVDATYLVWKFWYSYTEEDDYTDAQGNTHTSHHTVNVYHWAPEEYSVSGSQRTSRQIKYYAISSPLDLKVLNKVKVDNGAYGSINYDQNATKYDSLVSFDVGLHNDQSDNITVPSKEAPYQIATDGHEKWPAGAPTYNKGTYDTGKSKKSYSYFASTYNYQQVADNTEDLTVQTRNDRIKIGKTASDQKEYLNDEWKSSHVKGVYPDVKEPVNPTSLDVTEVEGSGGDYYQTSGENGQVRVPDTTKNGKYWTTVTFTYGSKVPTTNKTKDWIIDNETDKKAIYSKYKNNEPIVVRTPVISPISITNAERNTQLIHDPVESYGDESLPVYKCFLDGTYTVQFSPKQWYSEEYGNKILEGYDQAGNEGGDGTENTAARYDKYVKEKLIRFPFPVEVDGHYYALNGNMTEWITIPESNELSFYIPTWVKESNTVDYTNQTPYIAEVRVESVSSDGVDDTTTEYEENSKLENHVATYNIYMNVSGLVYNFQIVGTNDKDMFKGYRNDINEDPNYAFVPVNEEKKAGTFNRFGKPLTRYTYTGKNAGEWPVKNTVPLRAGSSSVYSNMGALWKGTTISFSLKTIANLDSNNDVIKIQPRFKYIDYNGNILYMDNDGTYDEESGTWKKYDGTHLLTATVDGKTTDKLLIYYTDESGQYIEVNSTRDKNNVHTVSLSSPQFEGSWYQAREWYAQKLITSLTDNYVNAIPNVLSFTSNLEGLQPTEYVNRQTSSYTMNGITLYPQQRLYSGDNEELERNQGLTRTDGSFSTPAGAEETTYKKSMQTWYGQYSIPKNLYVTTVNTLKQEVYGRIDDSDSSDNLLQKYAKMGKLSEDSPIWKTTGYLVVGFDITTMNEGHEHLRYGGDPFNSLNMWKGDGQPKTDGSERPIQLDNGGFTSEKTVAEWRANKRENQPDKATIELQAPRYEDSSTNNGTVKTTTVPIDSGDVVFVDLRYTQNDKYKSRIFMIN